MVDGIGRHSLISALHEVQKESAERNSKASGGLSLDDDNEEDLQNLNLIENSIEPSTQDVSGNYNFTGGDVSLGKSEMGIAVAEYGLSFVGKINNDSQGNARFSGGSKIGWCAAFVSTIVKEAYAKAGKTAPEGFGSSSPKSLQNWGIKNGCYAATDKMSQTDRAKFIAENIKPGDIMVQVRNGRNHVAIVTKVNPNGSYETVDGNSADKVRTNARNSNDDKLSGFIKMP